MSKRRPVHTGKHSTHRGRDRTEYSLPMSLIIPLGDNVDKLELCLESLRKIKRPFSKNYEVLIAGRDMKAARKILGEVEEELLGKGILKLIETEPQVPSGIRVQTALQECSKDNILVFEPQNLEKGFNFEELFSIREEELREKHVIIPVFREQEIQAGRDHVPMMLLDKKVAGYIFGLGPVSGDRHPDDYQSAFFYRLRGLNIEPLIKPVSQVNPFGEARKVRRPFPGGLAERFRNYWDWNFRVPGSELRSAPHRKYSFLDQASWYRSLFAAAAILIAVLLPLLSLDAGQSGDDEKHYMHAEKVYNYFATRGEDKSALEDPRLKLNFYGQSVDLLTYIINKAFRIEKEYEARHFIIAITGFLCILFAGLLARRLAGYRAGLITMLLMFLAPRFMGHAMNNPMDVPFALGYIFTLYHTFRFLENLPDFSVRRAVWISLGIAFTISIRIGGLLLIPYIFMFAGIYVLVNRFEFKNFSTPWFRMVWKGITFLVLISVGGYFVSLIPWPYGFQQPLKNPFEALRMMSNISVAIRVLFDGAIIWSNRLPWYYISMNILYTVPVVLLTGLLLSVFLYPFYRKDIKPAFIFFLFFVVVFPVAYVVYKESNVYGGWRHLMFIFPAMAVLSGIAWDRLVRILKAPPARYAVLAVLVAGMIHPLVHIIRNHPLQYIYFNELLGVKKAYGRFETDYYMNSLKQGAEWLADAVLQDAEPAEGKRIEVATNGSVTYYLRHLSDKVRPVYTRYYDRGEKDWDYAVYFCNYIDPFQLGNGLWPPAGTFKTIDVNGVPVCAIVKRESKEDMEAIRLVMERDYTNGIPALEEVNRKYPNNEIVKLRLAEAYIHTGQFAKVDPVINECLAIYPNYDKALNLKGVAYMEAGDLSRAKTVFLQITRINHRFASAYHNLGMVHIRMQPPDLNTAIEYFKQALQTNSRYKPSYQALAAIYRQQGYEAEAQRYENAARGL